MLSEQVRRARERAGLSIYEVRRQTGLGLATISDIEAGKNKNPGILTVTKLADLYGMSLDVLMERAREIKPSPLSPEEQEPLEQNAED